MVLQIWTTMDISAMTNSMSSWKMPAITYLDIWSERSSRNLIATRIIRSALKSFYRYVKQSSEQHSRAWQDFTSVSELFSPWIGLCFVFCLKAPHPPEFGRYATALQTTHTHTHSRNVEVRSAKWCEFQYFVSAAKREQSLRERTYTPGQLLVQECKAQQKPTRTVFCVVVQMSCFNVCGLFS